MQVRRYLRVLRATTFTVALVGALLGAACIGDSPEEQLAAAQGRGGEGEPEHRPGQACLACHSSSHNPGGDVFVLAGTIYEFATDRDEDGLEGAEVQFLDAAGHEFTAISNRAGNFMVQVRTGLDAPQLQSRGRLRIPWQPVFPLTVAVVYQGVDKSMDSQIWREGSCAGCHRTSEAGTDHVEKVWHNEASP